jgi:hypothetical protein
MRKVILIVAISALFVPLLPASAALAATGDILVATGTVTDSFGSLFPGAAVRLYAWPSDDVLGGLASGQAVPTTLLATTTADSNGRYSLSVSPASLAAAAVSGTDANLEVDSSSGSWFFVIDTANPVPVTADVANAATGPGPGCGPWVYLYQLDRAWATVGSAYIWRESPGVTGTVAYKQSQSSHLGIGLSATAAYGSFSADGTNSETSATTVGFPEAYAGYFQEFQTHFRTALYQKTCSPGGVSYHARANGWLGGQNIVSESSAPSTQAKYCETYYPGAGSYFLTSNEDAKTWSSTLGLGIGNIGFNATAKTGYDTNASLKYNFANATQTNYVCGTNSYAPNAWRTVVQSHT